MGLIDSGCKPLTIEKSLRLQCTHGSVLALGHIKDNRMSVELRRGITVHRASGVMLKLRCDKLPRSLCGMIASDAGLCVPLQFVQGGIDGLAVRFANTVIPPDKRS